MQIKKYKNGMFQVWDGENVIRPYNLERLGKHQSHHSFMFVGSKEEAKEVIDRLINHEIGLKVESIVEYK